MRIIVPIIIGAIIGYSTNWLAIRMLFRPYHEKKAFGIKIPFTPGLIPKERGRMAKSIGETVGVHLLSPDTIIQSLSNKDTDNMIKDWLENKLDDLKNNTKPMKEILDDLPQGSYDITKLIEEKSSDLILKQLKTVEFKEGLINILEAIINNIDMNNLYELIGEKSEKYILELANSKDLNDNLKEFIKEKLEVLSKDTRTLSESLPETFHDFANTCIDSNGERIGDSIREIFMDYNIQRKLKSSISDLVSQNTSKIIMAFVSPDLISEKIFHMIEKYIKSEETNKDILMIINLSIDKLFESKISDMVEGLKANIADNEIEIITEFLISSINNKDIYDFVLKTVLNKLKKSEDRTKDYLLNYLNTNIDKILQSIDLEKTIRAIVHDMINKLSYKPVNSIISNVSDNEVSKVYGFCKAIFEKFARIELPKIIEAFNISKIVEDKVNSFEVDFTEKLILDIAKKELNAITWLGALLGGFIGLLSSLLQMLY